MKVMKDKGSGRVRLVMRRDQILKLCCNHYISSGMKIDYHMGNEKALIWFTTADYSEEGNPLPQKLIARFKTPEIAKALSDINQPKVSPDEDNSRGTSSNNSNNGDDDDDRSSHSSMPPLEDC